MIINRAPINAWLAITDDHAGGFEWLIMPTSKWWRVDWYSRHYETTGSAIAAAKRTARSLGIKIVEVTVDGIIQGRKKL